MYWILISYLLVKHKSYNIVSVKVSHKSLPLKKCMFLGINQDLTRWRGQCLDNNNILPLKEYTNSKEDSALENNIKPIKGMSFCSLSRRVITLSQETFVMFSHKCYKHPRV